MNPLAKLLEVVTEAFKAYQRAPDVSNERRQLWEEYVTARDIYLRELRHFKGYRH